jgi:hypothetical protein
MQEVQQALLDQWLAVHCRSARFHAYYFAIFDHAHTNDRLPGAIWETRNLMIH